MNETAILISMVLLAGGSSAGTAIFLNFRYRRAIRDVHMRPRKSPPRAHPFENRDPRQSHQETLLLLREMHAVSLEMVEGLRRLSALTSMIFERIEAESGEISE